MNAGSVRAAGREASIERARARTDRRLARGTGSRHPKPSRSVRGALALAVALAAVVACSPANGPASPSATPANPSHTPNDAKPTSWPTTVVSAATALGGANGEFQKMSDDLSAAVSSQDPARILTAVKDAITFLKGNETNIPHLQGYDFTKSVGDRLAAAYSSMIDGLTTVRDGLTSGNASAVEGGFATFVSGSQAYADVTPDLAALAEQAVLMKRLLLK
jgi:hypothetical protein